MTERPILMTPENAQKCHVGVKTQTRRILKPPLGPNAFWEKWESPDCYKANGLLSDIPIEARAKCFYCPYGLVGDRLWVREALYNRGAVMIYVDGTEITQDGLVLPSWGEKKTVPSIHMPRWACRTVLEIVRVRVERVQEISEDDARAEGCAREFEIDVGSFVHCTVDFDKISTYKLGFKHLWTSIHGPGSWDANPWVWVLEFRRG